MLRVMVGKGIRMIHLYFFRGVASICMKVMKLHMIDHNSDCGRFAKFVLEYFFEILSICMMTQET